MKRLLLLAVLGWGGAVAAGSDAGRPAHRSDAGALSKEDQELLDNLDLLQNLDTASDMDLLIDL